MTSRIESWLTPRRRKTAAGWGVWLSLVLWPVSMFTVFATEPPGILSLSWLALTLTLVDIWLTTDVRTEQEE